MKKIFYTIIAAAAMLTGCNTIIIEQEGNGSLSIDLDCKTDYTDVITKAMKTDDEIINELSVDIVRPIDGWSINYTPFSTIRGTVVELGSGSYILTASSPEKKDAAFDQPIFEGSKNFDIRTGEVTTIDLTCTISNVMVTLMLTDNFASELSDYTVTVSNSKGSLSWTKISDEINDFEAVTVDGEKVHRGKQAGFFTLSDRISVIVNGHRSIDGSEASTLYYIDNPQVADNHILTLDAKVIGSLSGKDGGLDISISYDVNPIDQLVVVPGFEEVPVPGDDPEGDGDGDDTGEGDDTGDDNTEDPVPSTAPILIWEANEDFSPMNIDENLDANLVIEAPGVIAEFLVIVDSEVLSPTIAALCSYADDYTGGPAEMNMISDEILIENLAAMDLGLPLGEEILGQTSVPFSLSGLIPLIDIYGPESGAEHKFTLKVTDENGDSFEKLLIFVTI